MYNVTIVAQYLSDAGLDLHAQGHFNVTHNIGRMAALKARAH
jgi:hypothetical protein